MVVVRAEAIRRPGLVWYGTPLSYCVQRVALADTAHSLDAVASARVLYEMTGTVEGDAVEVRSVEKIQ
jgi:hypothetical protein